jgi:signal transduction histidine kinase
MLSPVGQPAGPFPAARAGRDPVPVKARDMRLADFILANVEPILGEWEAFARRIWPGPDYDPRALRDHAADILRATVRDMESDQTAAEQSGKSRGDAGTGRASAGVDRASDVHAAGRVRSGFDVMAVVAEYRALRASVIRLWHESDPRPHDRDLADLTRFNESVDQSLTEAVRGYTERVDRSRRMFLAILGHDLRNPLNAIGMSAQVLAMADGLDAETAAVARQVSTSAAAMGRMVADLLDFTGTGLGGAMPLSPAAADLGRVCGEVVDETRAAHPGRAVRFAARGDLTGEWDAARLRQVVSNLLGNAVQHAAADAGPIDVSAEEDGPGVRVAVRNGGPPIPADALPTIFDPLVRADAPGPGGRARPRRPGSLGLGLYIAREVAAAHGGTIGVESSAEAGTTFTVRLPRRVAAGR